MYLYNVLDAALQLETQLGTGTAWPIYFHHKMLFSSKDVIFIIRCFFILLQFPFVLTGRRRSLSRKASLACMPMCVGGSFTSHNA